MSYVIGYTQIIALRTLQCAASPFFAYQSKFIDFKEKETFANNTESFCDQSLRSRLRQRFRFIEKLNLYKNFANFY